MGHDYFLRVHALESDVSDLTRAAAGEEGAGCDGQVGGNAATTVITVVR